MEERLVFQKNYPSKAPDLEPLFHRRPLPYVFLETLRFGPYDKRSLLFEYPVEVLLYRPGDQVDRFFARIEQALEQGFWLAGFFSYEFVYWLLPELGPLKRLKLGVPLAWLGVFKHAKDFSCPFKVKDKGALDLTRAGTDLPYERYAVILQKIKDYIAQGDVYQINFTFRYLFDTPNTPEELYLALRARQKVSYAALIRTPEFSVVSFSPELFFRAQRRRIWTSPMKGTIHRGVTLEEDQALAQWLAKDTKNQAENVMIVDLLRNDLGRVCQPGSVFVRELFKVEQYETLHQMISTVEGTLPRSVRLKALWQALFPCGSVTGAPKLRSMQIINELESSPRGVYTGAVGYFSPQGDLAFNVAIRTLSLSQNKGELGIGSGVVWDSDPRMEYDECLLKASFLVDKTPCFQLVETMLFDPLKGIPLLDLHLKRLRYSAAYFGFALDIEGLKRVLASCKQRLSKKAKIRVLLSKDGSLELQVYTLAPLSGPVKIGLAPRQVDAKWRPFLFHKTTYRPWYEGPRKEASFQGLFDVLFVNEQGELTEGTISNLFIELEGKLFTPPLKAGLLPGVLRWSLLRSGQVKERSLRIRDLERATKIFVGNAVRGLMPVASWFWL